MLFGKASRARAHFAGWRRGGNRRLGPARSGGGRGFGFGRPRRWLGSVLRPERVDVFSRLTHYKQIRKHRDQRSLVEEPREQRAFRRRRDFESGLIGLDVGHDFAGRNRVPRLLPPLRNQALLHRIAKLRYFYRHSHVR